MSISHILFDTLSNLWGLAVWAWKYIVPIFLLAITYQVYRKYSWKGFRSREYWKIFFLAACLPAGICYVVWLLADRGMERYDMRRDGRLRIDIRRS